MSLKKMFAGVVFAFLVFSAVTIPGNGHEHYVSGSVDIDIIGDDRGSLGIFPDRGWQSFSPPNARGYVEARRGERYRIRVRNRTSRRIGLVVAVDGRNIVSGEKSYLRSSEGMYILNPFSSGDFEGWRTSRSGVHRFFFTDESNSYAGAWGDYSRMGIIDVAVFQERYRYYEPPSGIVRFPSDEFRKDAGKPSSPSRDRSSGESLADSQAGTGYGEHRYSPVYEVDFDAETFAGERYQIRYEWPENLYPVRNPRYVHPPDPPYYEPQEDRNFTPPPPRRY